MPDPKFEGKSGAHIQVLRALEAELHRRPHGRQINVWGLDFQSAQGLLFVIRDLEGELSRTKSRARMGMYPPHG